jgi:hypothetical protein
VEFIETVMSKLWKENVGNRGVDHICGVICAAVTLIGRFGMAADNDIRAKIIFQIRERKIRIYNFTITH